MPIKPIKTAKDIIALKPNDEVSVKDLYNVIVDSKCRGTDAFLGASFVINNTPQQGINWIGDDYCPKAVIIKTKLGNYEEDSLTEYAFKARHEVINYSEKANQVLINPKNYGYPILYFKLWYGNWRLLGRFQVKAEKETSVLLDPFASKKEQS